ncbi:MAG: hypothetical protein A2V99_13430 [Spirochaetes bacterium RBG_16_67_19]|jgi:hypothetical protein|nr:MAG: hypothetical protein A2V99_13430 [Spirochaetes bacterium RBG_16_67_19]
MLRRIILAIIVLGAAGLVVGYLIFARTTNGYLSLKSLVTPAQGLEKLGELIKYRADVPQIRQSILICGAVGGGIGLVGAAVAGGGRRRRR